MLHLHLHQFQNFTNSIQNTQLFSYSRGLKVTSGAVTIVKDETTNMIGISIGGGAPNCPCLYIVQVGFYILSHI